MTKVQYTLIGLHQQKELEHCDLGIILYNL